MLINNINMKEQIKRIPLSDFQLDKKPTMDDYDYISTWVKEALKMSLIGIAFIVISMILYMMLLKKNLFLYLGIKAMLLLS